MQERKADVLRTTLMVLIGLGILTAVEFGVSKLESPTIALIIISLFKAGLILNYFMHITDLWSEEDHE
jgi:cytochrome c oxidase subunit IV